MRPNDSLVSIVIPVYNVERYLDACLESVVNQSYTSTEIILVDDGSTDNSGKLCDEWKDKDSRIKIIHKKNEGLNYARKSGWEIATGEYITFLDSDDLFHIDNIKNTMSIAVIENLDMVACMYLNFSDSDEDSGSIEPKISDEHETKRSSKDAVALLFNTDYEDLYSVTAWGKIYKKKLVDMVDWKQSNMKAYEDMFFTPQMFVNVSSFAVLKQQLYYYRRNDSGLVLSKMLTGNNHNGKPIGYLEYIEVLKDYWTDLFKVYDSEFYEDVNDFCLGNMHYRLNNLLAAGMLCEENNTQYVGKIIDGIQNKARRDLQERQTVIDEQSKALERIGYLENKITELESEIAQLKTLRGSLHNVTSSVKHSIAKRKSS